MICLKNIWKTYKKTDMWVDVLKDISLDINDGELVSVMGASGSGKSTLLSIMGCLNKQTSGKLEIDNVDVDKLDSRQLAVLRAEKIGFVFQKFHLLSESTAIENVQLPMQYNPNINIKKSRERAIELLKLMNLGHRLDHTPKQMSGGECQRVAIARSLANEPSIILADEPTGNLDSKTGNEIMNLLVELNKKNNITVVIVTHDSSVANMTDRIIHIKDGNILTK